MGISILEKSLFSMSDISDKWKVDFNLFAFENFFSNIININFVSRESLLLDVNFV